MAGNIPPLVSSTPPPLSAFDEDEEEEEDEFGIYNTAGEIDYNECISFKEKDEEKPNVANSRREHNSTSQDSATDSGLCPDSEGVSPTPHSDDERIMRQNLCDRLCHPISSSEHKLHNFESENSERLGTSSIILKTVNCQDLPNGHVNLEDHCDLTESDDDFGNFEFAPSQAEQFPVREENRVSVFRNASVKEDSVEGTLRNESPSKVIQYTGEHKGKVIFNHTPPSQNEQFYEKEEESENADSCKSVECISKPFRVEENGITSAASETSECEQGNEFTDQKLDINSSNDSSSFNSVDSSLEPKNINSSEHENHLSHNTEKEVTENHENSTEEILDCSEVKETPIQSINNDDDDDDDEFNDFTDFKADFSGGFEALSCEKSDELNEDCKTFVEQTKLEERVSSLPQTHQEESDDEFSNFADFSSSDCAFVSAQSSNSLENVSHIPLKLDDSDLRTESEFQDWESVFHCEEIESPLTGNPALLRQDDVVWSRLFPLESSPALSYQWNESLANRRLLTSLNIDSRNILFMPWNNPAVPRFAANLSCGPLEPTKATEPLQLTVVVPAAAPTPPLSTQTQESVPDAHFDWVGSGLTNPLDCPKTVLSLPKTLSAEADRILSALRDISFMRKTYIDFPINEA